MDVHDCGSYEIWLPEEFDIDKFIDDAMNCAGDFWMLPYRDEGIIRFRGVYTKTGERLILDIWADESVSVAFTPNEEKLAFAVARSLHATKIYRDGTEITGYLNTP